jgi:putative endonuclease
MTTGSLGVRGEQLAADFLKRAGYRIICRNYRTRLGEIDIICQNRSTVVFVEVKTRSDSGVALPYESVGERKRGKLRVLAGEYLSRARLTDVDARFDVVSVVMGAEPQFEHIVGAF